MHARLLVIDKVSAARSALPSVTVLFSLVISGADLSLPIFGLASLVVVDAGVLNTFSDFY